MTPTPGDLSARHVEVLRGVLEAAVCPMKEHGCDGTQYPAGDPQGDYYGEQCQWCYERTAAIAALSALPAGGGKVDASGLRDAEIAAAFRIERDALAGLAPMPSALAFAIGVEYRAADIARTTPPADAAVGAQGEAAKIADEIMRQVQHGATVDWRPNMAEIAEKVRRLAAPAAGKGVDDAAVERARAAYKATKRYHTGDYPEGSMRSVADMNRNDDAAWRAAIEAALTRQPVAGDGEQATKDAFHDGVILALQVLTSGGDMGDAHYVELVNCCGLDELVKRARAEGMLKLSGLSDYRREHAPTGPAQGDGEVAS